MRYLVVLLILTASCTTEVEEDCNCTYVQYYKSPTSSDWEETYTSTWDFYPCEVGLLDKSTYTDFVCNYETEFGYIWMNQVHLYMRDVLPEPFTNQDLYMLS